MSLIRPAFHVSAAWLTVDRPDGTVDYFELDEEGELVLHGGNLIPHHTEKKPINEQDINVIYSPSNLRSPPQQYCL